MSAPVELRFLVRRATAEDIAAGAQYQRVPLGPMIQGVQPHGLFLVPPVLQYRYKEKTGSGVVWSDWCAVAIVREGDEDKDQGA